MSAFAPCIDGLALPRDPFAPDAAPRSAAVPLMIGTNKDETTLFNLGAPGFGSWTEEDWRRGPRPRWETRPRPWWPPCGPPIPTIRRPT